MPNLVTTIRPRGTSKQELIAELRRLPSYISGRVPDTNSYGKAFKSCFIHYLFKHIYRAFLIKSDGGTDETGEKWEPLKKETIAQRPLSRGETKRLGIQGLGRGGRGLLTAAQNRLWKGIFASTFAKLSMTMGTGAAKAVAAKLAWAILKSRGARTKLEVLGSRKVPILKVSGRLADSLAPGTLSGTTYQPPTEQVLHFHHGSVTMGTSVPYAQYLHKKRRLWPSIRRMSAAGWIAGATKDGVQGLTQAIVAKRR